MPDGKPLLPAIMLFRPSVICRIFALNALLKPRALKPTPVTPVRTNSTPCIFDASSPTLNEDDCAKSFALITLMVAGALVIFSGRLEAVTTTASPGRLDTDNTASAAAVPPLVTVTVCTISPNPT